MKSAVPSPGEPGLPRPVPRVPKLPCHERKHGRPYPGYRYKGSPSGTLLALNGLHGCNRPLLLLPSRNSARRE
jgi:hypothetical protein